MYANHKILLSKSVRETFRALRDFYFRHNCPTGDVNWLPRSCDLTPLDFFLWGYLKSQVYTNKPQTIDTLKVNITNAIQQIQPDLCEKVIENWPNTCHQAKPGRTFERRYIPYLMS